MSALYGIVIADNDKRKSEMRFRILEYLNDRQLGNALFLEFEAAAHTEIIETVCSRLAPDDTLLITNLFVLSNTLEHLLEALKTLLEYGVCLHVIDDNLILSPANSNALELIASLLKTNTTLQEQRKEVRRERMRSSGVKAGRKKGALVSSRFDAHRSTIEELYALGLSMRKIVEHINVGTQQSLHHYITSRGITR